MTVTFSHVCGIFAFIAALLQAGCVAPATTRHGRVEAWYADALADSLGGQREVRMRNGTRCDVLDTTHSIEVEFAGKWCESIGQALNYSSQTGRLAGVALIVENASDERFLTRLREVVAWHQLQISIVVLRPHGADGLTIELPPGMSFVAGRVDFLKPNTDLPKKYR